MLDLTTEAPIPLAEAAKIVPPGRAGKKTHLSTLLRWIVHGAKDPAGNLIKLEALRLGGRWMTSREALQRFAERLTPPLDAVPRAEAPRPPSARSKAAERAGRELERIGI